MQLRLQGLFMLPLRRLILRSSHFTFARLREPAALSFRPISEYNPQLRLTLTVPLPPPPLSPPPSPIVPHSKSVDQSGAFFFFISLVFIFSFYFNKKKKKDGRKRGEKVVEEGDSAGWSLSERLKHHCRHLNNILLLPSRPSCS